MHEVGRVGAPEDIGTRVVYLPGASSGFITGQHFVIDGGVPLKMQYV